ncbi:glycosyltransferase [Cytobacillus solani]|uniref:glycosyltransferase n=1 Tax=Cytobacillus solani TaxID=1637975 RepID=UPI00207A01BE|nr:glycosyltransferase [Cytobacillus solani]USK54618.1 glycosyltransferase [Cytobacillus solani]
MSKNTVSLCMIVKDEEAYLRRCLESVSNKVDEIIIVDTGSTDSTLCIAEEYSTKIYKYAWQGNFAEARNFSIENAISEYILVLDADEYLDEDTNLQKALDDKKDYYIINFKNYMDGGYVSNHQAIRLFKNNIGLNYFGKIHEHLNIDDFNNLSVSFADFIIHHDGYKKDVFTQKNKFDRNLKILEKEVKSNPTGYNLFNLGTQYKVGREYIKALEQFKKSYPLSKNQIYLPYLLYSMGDCLLHLGRNNEGINLMEDSIILFPKYTGFYYLKGLFYENLNYFKAAENAFEKCLELGEVEHFQSIEGVGSYIAYIKLSEIHQKQGNLLKALDSSFTGMKLKKNFPPSLSQYISVLTSAGIDEKDIIENLKQTYPIMDSKDIEILIRVLYAHRSKLIKHYIDEYKISVNNSIIATISLYNKKYDEACSHWCMVDKINPEILNDILTLLIVEKNEELLEKVMQNLNLNKKEKKVICSLIRDSEEVIHSLTDSLFSIFKTVSINLLKIKEEALFFDLYRKLTLMENEKEQLISLMIHNGFLKVAIDLLTDELEKNDENYKLIGLLGDAYLRLNKLNEALALYIRLIEKNGDYFSYNRLYNLYEKIGYSDGMQTTLKAMNDILALNYK